MRILLLIHKPQARGQEIFASLLGNELMDKGHEVVLISMYSGDFVLPFNGKQIRLNLNSSLDSANPLNWRRFSRLVHEFNPDVVQANGGDTLKFAVLARLIFPFSGKLIFNNGGVLGFYLVTLRKRIFYRFILRSIDGAVCVSQHSADDLRQFLSKHCPLVQIPIGIKMNQLSHSRPASELQVFVHIAGFTPEKNHPELILVFSKYLQTNPSAQLWMIGDGPLRPEMEQLADGISLGSFRFLRALSDPWKVVPRQAILLLPSQIEGMPSVLVEAMLFRIPIIAYAVGGISEIADHSSVFRLIEPGNSTAFLQAMIDFSKLNRALLDVDLDAAKAMAVSRFSFSKSSDQFVQFYSILCGSSR